MRQFHSRLPQELVHDWEIYYGNYEEQLDAYDDFNNPMALEECVRPLRCIDFDMFFRFLLNRVKFYENEQKAATFPTSPPERKSRSDVECVHTTRSIIRSTRIGFIVERRKQPWTTEEEEEKKDDSEYNNNDT